MSRTRLIQYTAQLLPSLVHCPGSTCAHSHVHTKYRTRDTHTTRKTCTGGGGRQTCACATELVAKRRWAGRRERRRGGGRQKCVHACAHVGQTRQEVPVSRTPPTTRSSLSTLSAKCSSSVASSAVRPTCTHASHNLPAYTPPIAGAASLRPSPRGPCQRTTGAHPLP